LSHFEFPPFFISLFPALLGDQRVQIN